MRNLALSSAALSLAVAVATPAMAQSEPTITLYELPAYLGRSVTIRADAPDLADNGFAKRARSARVNGEWRICPSVNFGGSCKTVSADQPVLTNSQVVSLRAPVTATAAAGSTGSAATAASASAGLDLAALDVGDGNDGQDVTFYARPSLSGTEVSAGTNDIASASAFCKLAGGSTAAAAGRSRSQASNIIDLNAKSRVRGYALRDVLCRR